MNGSDRQSQFCVMRKKDVLAGYQVIRLVGAAESVHTIGKHC